MIVEKWYVLAMTASRNATLVGTGTGRPFGSEKSAVQAMNKLSKQAPTLQLIPLRVLPLTDALEMWGR